MSTVRTLASLRGFVLSYVVLGGRKTEGSGGALYVGQQYKIPLFGTTGGISNNDERGGVVVRLP